ncbi:CARDB domain-containing protein [Halopiger goleimassiliensis]|uniref:CARDB domain-containing protein n=1 Tax=Halopiger goleimassiliensis TaxID=1293048 RepID=UPI001E5B2D69|nr:CARDB domain-containing protein [Halopiger goleimassiliensis]
MTHQREKSIITTLAICIVALGIALGAGVGAAEQTAALDELEGDGTGENPYVITNAEELQAMNQDLEAHYILGNDIDASDTEHWAGGTGFEPIGDSEYGDRTEIPFSGTFDGRNHTVKGLTIDRPGDSYIGLFGTATGTVENVEIENAFIRGDQYVGGVIGQLEGEGRSIAVTGEVEGNEYVGGVVGRNRGDPILLRAYADVSVNGDEYIGGIVGANAGTIMESHTTSTVEATDGFAGGITGNQYSSGAVRQSYAAANVEGNFNGGIFGDFEGSGNGIYSRSDIDTSNEYSGGIAGGDSSDGSGLTDVYWDVDMTKTDDSIGTGEEYGTGLKEQELTGEDPKTNTNLDFGNYWTATDEYPVLKWQIQDVDLQIAQPSIGEGETTSVTVELTLDDGSTVTATEVADYDSEEAVAEVTNGLLEANSVGETELTATVAGESDSVTVEVLEPPSIDLVDTSFDTEAAVEGTTLEAAVTYQNTGGPGSETATVAVGDEQVTRSTVHVDADGETTETLRWTAAENGTVALNDEPLGDLSIYEPGTVGLESVSLPEEAAAGSEYDLEVGFTNEADEPVAETVEVRIDGESVATETVTVDADGSTETFTLTHDEQGTATHVVELHDETETATIDLLEPAEFQLEAFDAPASVTEGESATINATVTNVGGGADEASVALTVDDESVDETTVELEAGASESLEFDTTLEELGDVTVGLESPDDVVEAEIAVTEADGDGIPGFGPALAVVAMALAASAVAMRRRILA